MRRLKSTIILATKKAKKPFYTRGLPKRYIHQGVPYYSQWESPELVEQLFAKEVDVRSDPNWRNSGAENVEEYAQWSWNGCGMACLKMILAWRGVEMPLAVLGKMGVKYGVYQLPLDSSPGMFHKPFVPFVRQEFGLHAKAVSALTLPEIKRAIVAGGLVIASVTPEIRYPETPPMRRGGHLVLVFGFDDEQGVFYLHNPSGNSDTQKNVKVSYKNFSRCFGHKGLIVFAPRAN